MCLFIPRLGIINKTKQRFYQAEKPERDEAAAMPEAGWQSEKRRIIFRLTGGFCNALERD
jgi:hypothetical protein